MAKQNGGKQSITLITANTIDDSIDSYPHSRHNRHHCQDDEEEEFIRDAHLDDIDEHDDNNDDDDDYYYHHNNKNTTNNQHRIIKSVYSNSSRRKSTSLSTNSNSQTHHHYQQQKQYYSNNRSSAKTSSVSNDSSPISESGCVSKKSAQPQGNSSNNTTTTTSGVTSNESASNSLINSSDNDMNESADHQPPSAQQPVNTIKYNAKTNKLLDRSEQMMKSNENNNNKKLVLISSQPPRILGSGMSAAPSCSNKRLPATPSSSYKQKEYILVRSHDTAPTESPNSWSAGTTTRQDDDISANCSFLDNHSDDIHDVSIEVECTRMMAVSSKPSNNTTKPIKLASMNKNGSNCSDESSSSASVESSTNPSASLSPANYPLTTEPLPFPTSHFLTFQIRNQSYNSDNNKNGNQPLGKLNSSSSLTMVSKMPTSSYAYISGTHGENDEDEMLCDDEHGDNQTINIVLSNGAGGSNGAACSSLSSTSSGCSSLENNHHKYKNTTSNYATNGNNCESKTKSVEERGAVWAKYTLGGIENVDVKEGSHQRNNFNCNNNSKYNQNSTLTNKQIYRPTTMIRATSNNGNESNSGPSTPLKKASKVDYV